LKRCLGDKSRRPESRRGLEIMTARMKLSINLPAEVLNKLDKARGDVTRSIFIQRSVERTLTYNGAAKKRRRR
jgi:metal-responsive CopG/Arc/MetJ family transcriptional regulator